MPMRREREGPHSLYRRKPGFFYGWTIVGAAWVIMLLCAGAQIGSFPVFFSELKDYFGWSRGSLALGFTLNTLLMALFAPLAGAILNRVGPKSMVFIGAVVGGGAMALISLTTQKWHFYASYGLLMPLGLSLAYYVPTVTTVRRWFSRRAAIAVSIAMTGSGAGLAAGPPLASYLINTFGWQDAYRILAFILAAGVAACALLLKSDPESAGTYPDGIAPHIDDEVNTSSAMQIPSFTVRQSVFSRTLWLYITAQAGYLIMVMAMLAHMKVWGEEDLGLGESYAVTMISVLAITAILGRLAGGFVSDLLMPRFGRKPVLYFCVCGVILSAFLALGVEGRIALAFFAVILGLAYGSGVGVFPTYLGDLFGVASLPVLLGIAGLESASVGALGPWIFGTIYDQTESYDIAFLVGGACGIISLICLILIRSPGKS
ncbi:MAG: MFS transporter [Dehalococcoidia bacterium]